jgi:uncharacterized protein YjdB
LQGGIFDQANRASESYKIADLRDRIEVIRMAWIADKAVDPSLPITDLWDRLIKADIIATRDDVEGPEKDESGNDVYILNTKDGYTVEIIVNDKGHVTIGDIVKGNMPPKIRRIETSATKSSITAKAVVSRLKNGTVEYYYKLSTADDSTYTKIEEVTENGITVSTGITEGQIYTIKVIAKNENGEDTLTKDILAVDTILVENITLNKNKIIVGIKDAVARTLTATVLPENATNKALKWTSSNENVATVENGVMTPKALGVTTITVSSTDGSNRTATCTVKINQTEEIKDSNGNKITVPGGFEIVEHGTKNDNIDEIIYNYADDHQPCVQDGVVIQDDEDNQFVWIPVGTINNKTGDPNGTTTNITLGRYTFDKTSGTPKLVQNATNYATTTNLRPSGYDYDFQELISSLTNTPAKSLSTFVNKTNASGGYYLARYEASKSTDGKVNSKANKTVWNYITQPNTAIASRNMYNNSYVDSDLVNSYMWDTAIVFIQNYSGNSNYANKKSVNSSLANTGKAGDKVCNIHDMASNVYEWTTEHYTDSDTPCTIRGGRYDSSLNFTARRVLTSTTNSSSDVGFRIGFYIK